MSIGTLGGVFCSLFTSIVMTCFSGFIYLLLAPSPWQGSQVLHFLGILIGRISCPLGQKSLDRASKTWFDLYPALLRAVTERSGRWISTHDHVHDFHFVGVCFFLRSEKKKKKKKLLQKFSRESRSLLAGTLVVVVDIW